MVTKEEHDEIYADAIKQAYGDAIKGIWKSFFDALVIAKNNQDQAEAYERFLAGLTVAQQTYDLSNT